MFALSEETKNQMKRLLALSLLIACAVYVFMGAARSVKSSADARNAALEEIIK